MFSQVSFHVSVQQGGGVGTIPEFNGYHGSDALWERSYQPKTPPPPPPPPYGTLPELLFIIMHVCVYNLITYYKYN